jgi:hypothetical protein
VPGREQGTILASMTLRRCDVSDAAVPMFIVVPMDEGPGPLSCRVEFGETFDRKFRPVFGGAEQRLGVRIVIADARSRVRRFDAEPVQHGQNRGGLQGGAVVTV